MVRDGTGREGRGRDGRGRVGTGRDGTARDGMGWHGMAWAWHGMAQGTQRVHGNVSCPLKVHILEEPVAKAVRVSFCDTQAHTQRTHTAFQNDFFLSCVCACVHMCGHHHMHGCAGVYVRACVSMLEVRKSRRVLYSR